MHEAIGDLVLKLSELVEPEELTFDVGDAHEEQASFRLKQHPAGALLLVAHCVQQIQEAPLRQVVGGELLRELNRGGARSRP